MFLWIIVGVLLSLVAVCEYYTWHTGVPTVTSLPSIRKKMIELLREEAKNKGGSPFIIYDLGSGTGKLALEIERAIPQAQIIGIELSIFPYLLSLVRRRLWRSKRVVFRREDFWGTDLSSANAVVVYMNANIRARMAEKLKESLPDGALVILNETELPGWNGVQLYPTGLLKLNVVVYRKH